MFLTSSLYRHGTGMQSRCSEPRAAAVLFGRQAVYLFFCYTYLMKKVFSQGFTVLEMLIILAIMAILIGMVVVSFDQGKKQTADKTLVAELRSAQVALEEYRAQCKVYPLESSDEIDLDADNIFPGAGSACSITLGDVWPGALGAGAFEYIALKHVSTGNEEACAGYHIAVELSGESAGLLAEDDDYTGDNDWERCDGVGADAVSADDTDNWYDRVIGPSNI